MASSTKDVYVIGTFDTKKEELLFLATALSSSLSSTSSSSSPHSSFRVKLVDISSSPKPHPSPPQLPQNLAFCPVSHVLSFHPDKKFSSAAHEATVSLPEDRGEAVTAVSAALAEMVRSEFQQGRVGGAIGAGGSGGTAAVAAALRQLPVGVPKVLVSTVASGNTAPYVGTSDLLLFPSIADVAGLNSILRAVLKNAAAALAGMLALGSSAGQLDETSEPARPTVGITMFGVTTPCVGAVQKLLSARGIDSVVFHATGTGGRAMEENIASGLIQGVIDVTTTEVADLIVGGVMPCSASRFEAAINRRLPLVLSTGALDMVNFGGKESIPEEFKKRQLQVHNEQVTLMRTSAEESKKFAEFIAQKINAAEGPVRVVLPGGGVSLLDAPGMPFHDPEATGVLLSELEGRIEQNEKKKVIRLPFNINDSAFAEALVTNFLEIASPNFTSAPAPLETKPPAPLQPLVQPAAATPFRSVPKSLALPVIPEAAERRAEILQRLRGQVARGIPIIGGGAGTGISAKCEEIGGVDLIVIYNSGRFRMAGRGSLAGLLPFKDANAVVMEMAAEVLPIVKSVPVLAGVCATDPFRLMPNFLREVQATGFVGVQNFPTVGLFDGNFRDNIEETGMGYGLEVDMIAMASSLGLLTTPYAFNEDESRAMAAAGADIIVAHMGLTTAGSIGAKTALSLEASVSRVQAIADAARDVNSNVLVLCHGGPISGPKEAEFILHRTKGVDGFYGASSMERLPVEEAIVGNMKHYKSIQLRPGL